MYLARIAPLVVLGGCSLIYNPSNIHALADATDAPPMPDAYMQFDARVDTPVPVDADPSMLAIDSVTPGSIDEGAGDAGSRNALIVIHGKNLTQAATVQVTGATNVSVVSSQVSADGNWMAVLLHAAEMDSTPDTTTTTVPLTIAVSESGAPSPAMLSGQLVLDKWPQLTSGTTIAVSSLKSRYSRVALGDVTFTGTSSTPVLLTAVSSITMGTVTVAGKDASGNTSGSGGPGGCDGGAVGNTGGCSGFVGGGGGGAGNAGGGGGGYATDGGAGNGTGGGSAGGKHGNDQLVNLVVSNDPATTNQASGGGGGGGGSLLTAGGAAGGGGGTIQIEAGGNIAITNVVAHGGMGGNAGSIAGGAGGGGGGAGGIVIVRSAHGTVTIAADASPGAAGTGAGGGGGGGAGGLGRIRIDASASGAVPTTNPTAHRGPMFATATQQIVTDVNPMITLYGESMDVIDGYDVDAMAMDHEGEPKAQMFSNDTLHLVPAMLAGYNKLCFTLQPGRRGADLADTCLEIAYLP